MGLRVPPCPANGKLMNVTGFAKWLLSWLAEAASKTHFRYEGS